MPAVSKAQQRLMCGICHGTIKRPGGPSKATACEFCSATRSTAGLPERKRRASR